MPFNPAIYPADWKPNGKEKKLKAGNVCEGCGAPNRSIAENLQTHEPYMVHLSIAHKRQYETWKEDAETMVLCQRCHRRFDRKFRRKGGRRYHTPVGYASVYIEYKGQRVLVEMAKTLDDLRDVIAALPDPVDIEIQLVVILAVVGNGHYRKEEGDLLTIAEYGACIGLAPLM
ncbi:hypothetical protein KSF_030880 [Reticulibacter mediterranei]|uniref:Uncharacterized protein n=1 Tax=Reticulibacter mediterranei TaxID=2778369 RepID=A0A8J3N2B9_9CHLR|nr:hypothetical protein [Reticulibacter mediterranei]GHO93040.1 hypothetical protein KSF_030880 [Reticulibacter mediterranei]